ncbi:E3 ubiquitin-protein ligase, partial [Termitomyces sp. T112]
LDAHVDACLANESRRLEEETLRALEEQAPADEVWEESVHVDGAAGHVGSVRGTGFHTRNRDEQDIEDDVDIDGDDGFGDIQFTEGDVLPISSSRAEVNEDDDVEIEGNDEESHAQRTQQTLRDLIAEGRVVRNASGTELDKTKAKMEEVLGLSETDKMDLAILAAKKRGDKGSMITALENKIKQLV